MNSLMRRLDRLGGMVPSDDHLPRIICIDQPDALFEQREHDLIIHRLSDEPSRIWEHRVLIHQCASSAPTAHRSLYIDYPHQYEYSWPSRHVDPQEAVITRRLDYERGLDDQQFMRERERYWKQIDQRHEVARILLIPLEVNPEATDACQRRLRRIVELLNTNRANELIRMQDLEDVADLLREKGLYKEIEPSPDEELATMLPFELRNLLEPLILERRTTQ